MFNANESAGAKRLGGITIKEKAPALARAHFLFGVESYQYLLPVDGALLLFIPGLELPWLDGLCVVPRLIPVVLDFILLDLVDFM